jgi:glycosyltransferase involved in cell wall biosynthesis
LAEKRFTFVVPGSLDTPTGGYVYDKRMVAELREQGWTIQVCNLSDRFPEPDAAILESTYATLSSLPHGQVVVMDGLALGALPDIARYLGPDRPLVALVHHPLALETGLTPERADALKESERAALAATAHVITVSATTAALLTNEYGIEKPRIKVVPPGTDPAPFARGSTDGVVSLLAVGSVVPRKGYDLLIAALSTLISSSWRLTIAGDLTRDPTAAAELRTAIAEGGLQTRVQLLGVVPDEDLAALYESANVFVLPSYYEGYGMVFTDALARGLPVIGTTGGAVPESVPAGTGILVPSGDVAALTDALRAMIERPEIRAQHAAAARRAADHLPRWPLSAQLFGRAIEAVLP